MVSSLWKACADGDAVRVDELLKDASSVDVEIKDHTGVTPLIQAVKGGHVHVVKALIARGADPTNASAQGRPETYSSDPHILSILATARGEAPVPYPDPAQYYPYPPYPQYQTYPDPGAPYYPPPPPLPPHQQMPQEGEHAANLPPPEVARNIPCRYYPACRYGSACVFAHPQAPYFPGPLPPPAHYGPPPPNAPHPPPQHYDPSIAPPGAYPYYPVSPPFHPISPTGPPPGHMRAHSEVISPPPFSPTHLPMPMQYVPGPPPGPPMSPQYPPPPPSAYPRRASVTSLGSYPSPVAMDPNHGPPGPRSPEVQIPGRQRRGSAGFRDGRPPYANRNKPACLFYPSGRCRNGDDCRFPHVMPEGGAPPPPHSRGNFPPRSRGYYGSRDSAGNGNGYGNIEEKLAGLTVRDNNTPRDGTPNDTGGTTTPSSSTRPSAPTAVPHVNGKGLRAPVPAAAKQQPQRVPSADDFPVLRGSTPPQANGNGHPNGHAHQHYHANGWVNAVNGTGPTAAQLLREKDAGGSRGPSPRPLKDAKSQPPSTAVANGSAPENLASTGKTAEVQVSA